MRHLAVLLGFLLAACTPPKVIVYEVPVISPEPAIPTAVRPGGHRLMAVEKLYVWCDADQLRIRVSALANSGGWSEPRLNLISSEGRYLTYEIVARMPEHDWGGAKLDRFTVEDDTAIPKGISAVRVQAQTNEMIAAIGTGC